MNPAESIRREYLRRKEKNGSYSTRAFARDLGISQALISLLLAGKRRLSPKLAARLSIAQGLAPETREALQGVSEPVAAAAEHPFAHFEAERFQAIAGWEHVAILDLTTLQGFRSDEAWIARRLGLDRIVVRDAIERLLKIGLLRRSAGGGIEKSERLLLVPTRKSSPEIRAFHNGMIGRALEELRDGTQARYAAREISGYTIAANPKRIGEAKRRIRAFQKDLAAYLCEGPCTELYQLNTQFFPLTKNLKSKKGAV